MPLVFPLVLAAGLSAPVVVAADPPPAANPPIPIPTGIPLPPGPFISAEFASGRGLRVGAWWRSGDGTEFHVRSLKMIGAWAVQDDAYQDSVSRTTPLVRTGPGVGPAVMTRVEQFVGNSISVSREALGATGYWPLRVKVQYFPVEGVSFAVGFDTLTLDLFAGLELCP